MSRTSLHSVVIAVLLCSSAPAPAQPEWLENCLNGFVGGGAGILVAQPLDTIRVRIQTKKGESTAIRTFFCMVRQEGIASFWRGSCPAFLGNGIQNMILFGTYYPTLRYLGADSFGNIMIAGAVAGGTQTFVCTPLELLKTREQILNGKPSWRDTLAVGRTICVQDGVKGLYRGFWPTLLRDAPSYGLYFYVYKHLTQSLERRQLPSWVATFIGGGIADMAAWASIYPIDVIKSKVQASHSNEPDKRSFYRVLRSTYASGGRNALWLGFWVTMLRAFVLNGATFLGFEASAGVFRRMQAD